MSKVAADSVSRLDVRIEVVKWALPRENVPISVEWNPDLAFDKIEVDLPDDLEFVEFVNVLRKKIRKGTVEIRPMQSGNPQLPCYFGVVVRSRGVYSDLSTARKFPVKFIKNDSLVYDQAVVVRIFRPKLELLEYPTLLELADSVTPSLPLHLKYNGFGNIEVKLEAKIGGDIVSYGDSLVFEMLRRFWLSTKIDSISKKAALEGQKQPFSIDAEYVRRVTENLDRLIKNGKIPRDVLNEQQLDDIKRWLSNVGARKDRKEIMRARIENLLLEILFDIIIRNPAENVRLSSGHTNIEIRAPITGLELSIRYRDLMENEYEPITVHVEVADQRKDSRSMAIQIPIMIKELREEPLLNVAEMRVEGE